MTVTEVRVLIVLFLECVVVEYPPNIEELIDEDALEIEEIDNGE